MKPVVFFSPAVLMAAWAGSSGLAATAAEGEPNKRVTINTLGYFETYRGAGGVSEPVEIWFDEVSDGRMRLAFIEDEIDGYGESWRAAAWQAALVAADLSGRDLSETRVFLQRSGRVDGASAGAITAIGMLAALRGDTIRSDVAMTGTINPDGTIGPVGGVPHKIDGAAAAGHRLVLVPYGMRTDHDDNLDRDVDLFERGEEQGVEVRAVGDIYTAYEILTGKQLPRAAPASAPQLNNAIYQRVKIKVDEWLVRYRDQLAEYNEVPERHRSDYTESLIEQAKATAAGIDGLLEQGQAAAAYSDIVDAATLAGVASEVARTIWVDNDRGRDDAIAYAARFAQIKPKLRVAINKLRAAKPRTLGQMGTVIYAYATLTSGLCYRDLGAGMVSGDIKLPLTFEVETEEETRIERVLEGVYFLQVAAVRCQVVGDALEIAGELKGAPIPENLPLEATANFFRRASQANLNQFEKVIIDPQAESLGVSFARMQNAMKVTEEDYLVAWWGAHPARRELLSTFQGDDLPLARLGLAIHTYSLSSSLMARYYSLGAETDDDGVITGVRRAAPLKFMLDFAEDQTRRNIQSLRDAGVDPSEIVFNYQTAGVMRTRDAESRLYALQWLWEANVVARTMAYLGGFAAGVEPAATAAP